MQFQNHNTKNVALKSQTNQGQYEYDIELPGKLNKDVSEPNNVGSNHGSQIGHYEDTGYMGNNAGSQININSNNFSGMIGNINVKKSMMKIGDRGGERGQSNNILNRDMDMSPKSSKNEINQINFHNQN